MIKGEIALAEAEELLDRSIREQATRYVPDAIETLGKYTQGQQVGEAAPTASVVRQSARDIIEFAGGRPETRSPNASSEVGGVNIFITKYGSDDAPVHISTNGRDVVMEAELVGNKTVARKYEVPDAKPDKAEGKRD